MTRRDRKSAPLDAAALEQLALAYVARFATTRAKLEDYLRRKVREKGWNDEENPAFEEISSQMVEAGYVDDAAYAKAKASSLLRRGYGARRVGQALRQAGIGGEVADQNAPSEAEQRLAALSMVRKRGFGPFGQKTGDRAARERQIAAMQRAGHAFDVTLALLDARSVREAESWAAEALEIE